MKDKIIIFTDGASKGNPGPGAWGAIVGVRYQVSGAKKEEWKIQELGGFEKNTTNNRMELSGALSALSEIVDEQADIQIYTDSKYLINGMTGWIYGWQKNNWQTKEKKEVLNKDLWEKLAVAASGKNIKWNYVGGHTGIAGNERCDEIADALATGQKVDLYKGPISKYQIDILDFSHSEELKVTKYSKSAKAYSYLSLVDGKLNIDKTWAECEKKVKGKKGVKYKKAISKYHEEEIIRDWEK